MSAVTNWPAVIAILVLSTWAFLASARVGDLGRELQACEEKAP
jgi:hypothetical protein